MDAEPREYESLDDLRTYTYRVASVVGLWITEAFGIHDPWVLARAEALNPSGPSRPRSSRAASRIRVWVACTVSMTEILH